ncbi:MAG: hypothetical protein JOZ10_00075 [Acidobacteria bacterium]|nr:hypothetical protein [Acidobacteriota bacterium]MBV9147918.1 hypothetical protein [Acidobacteriota bacterium]MBV9436783.1 hypothetical protein [Acidobacteriota bacterium]
MVIKGIKHLAEINGMLDPITGEERFRYTLQREGSPQVLYWGHEHTEETAIQMANMYLNLLDDCATMIAKPGPRAQRVQFIAAPTAMRA